MSLFFKQLMSLSSILSSGIIQFQVIKKFTFIHPDYAFVSVKTTWNDSETF